MIRNFQQWLAWMESLNPARIELGLERVNRVVAELLDGPVAKTVVSVAGTNGKGSCVALLQAALLEAGYRVGVYTSPHLLRYNERVRVNGREASEHALCEAFERVDRARGEVPLTYFEFGTLAALDIFRRASLDLAILEVGLGGRLDAVNCVDPDVALITTVDLDHQDWLGDDRESIGREKAGIMRAGHAAVYGDADPVASVLEVAEQTGAELYCLGRDFDFTYAGRERWDWIWHPRPARSDAREERASSLKALPLPGLQGEFQLRNAAAVLAVLTCLPDWPVSVEAFAAALRETRVEGRFQILSQEPLVALDVAHNPQAAAALADLLAARPCAGDTHLVLGMLATKDADAVIGALFEAVDAWHVSDLGVPRALSAEQLAAILRRRGAGVVHLHASPNEALAAAKRGAQARDRIIVCGSFHTVAAVLNESLNSRSGL